MRTFPESVYFQNIISHSVRYSYSFWLNNRHFLQVVPSDETKGLTPALRIRQTLTVA